MAEVFETLHHITREARDRLAATGATFVTGGRRHVTLDLLKQLSLLRHTSYA